MDSQKRRFYPGDVPAKPGVYVFRDRFGEVVYVGKAANLRKRVSQYFQPSKRQTADPKIRSLISSIDQWEFFPVKNEDEALILESRFIKDYAPRYNTLLRDDKRFPLIKIDLNESFPRLKLARIRKDDNSLYFGPFPKSEALRDTIAFLSRHFKLRTCKALHPSETDRKHCLAKSVKDCCEPCVGKVTSEEYMERLEEMKRVLSGSVKSLTDELKERMTTAAAETRFEKAALFRDMITNLDEIFGTRNRSFRYAHIPSETGMRAVEDLRDALGIRILPSVVEGYDISNIGGTMAVASLVCFKEGKPSKKDYRRFKIRDIDQIDDFAMMNQVIKRRFKRVLEEQKIPPDLVMIDGGKGQLNAAIQALKEIGHPPVAIIGLAKKQEEIFIPGRSEPIVLDRHRPALRLLQAVRDEAHRFAITFHRELRAKRLQESMLDEIPGIGTERKKALLKAFGSLRELRNATPEEIDAKVPGIGTELSANILRHLKK